jgi:hypothetical protein
MIKGLMRQCLLPVLVLCVYCSASKAQQVSKVADVLTFTADDAKALVVKSGPGVTPVATFGATHGKDENLLSISFEISDTVAENARWFGIYPNEPLDPQVCTQADGIAINTMADPPGAWWLQVAIRGTDGQAYTRVLTPQRLDAKLHSRLIAFGEFKNKQGESLTADKVGKFDITGSVYPDRLLLIKEIYLYSHAKRTVDHGAFFHTNSPINNIFEPGKTVALQFDCPNGLPDDQGGLSLEIRDFFDVVVLKHTFKSSDLKGQIFTLDYAPKDSGYYAVQAWWVDADGKKLEDRSCLRTTGSMPDGFGTFAIMPRTIKQNQQRMTRVGDDAFLGLHGGHENLDELIGVTWKLKATRLKWVEPNKPADRPDGYAAWVKPLIEKTDSFHPWERNFVNLGINLNRPKWAISDTPDVAPGIKSWDIYMNFFRDYIQVNKHNVPHMKQRVYDLAWEINLNEAGSGIHKPVYHADDVVEIYRRARPILQKEDPGAILAGPCCSSPIKNFGWNIPLFEKGLFEFIDAYNCHGYHAPPPEEAMIPETFDKLRSLMKKYNHGKVMDIYITELGYRSMYGSEDRQADHARWHARVAGMLKGENIKVYYPFYSYDYTKPVDGSWGICYNLDPKIKFGPEKVSPKAAVPALAVFADQTEGFVPVTRLAPLSDDQWGYVYGTPDGKQVMAMLWSVYREHQFQLPVGNVNQVTVVDIMGRQRTLPAKDGMVQLTLTPSPVYVHGLSPELYPLNQTISKNLLAQVYPGDQSRVKLSDDLKNTEIQGVFGDVQVKRVSGDLALQVGKNCHAGLVGVMLKTADRKTQTRWLAVHQPVELVQAKLVVENGQLIQQFKLHNHAQQTQETTIELTLDKQQQSRQQLTLAGSQIKELSLPLALQSNASPTKTWQTKLTIDGPTIEPIEMVQSFNLLAAHEVATTTQGKFNNQAVWSGKGASGQTDQATANFQWQKDGLLLDICVNDDVFDQRKTDGIIWQQDSIQIGFDTHPDLKEIYEPLAGIFTKKLCRLAFALTPQGPLAWRHDTHNAEQLALGDFTADVQMKIERDEKQHVTNYQLMIPWKQIGLDEVKAGKSIGMSILVNDSDGPATKRAMYELFSGLTTRLPQNNGRLTLQ